MDEEAASPSSSKIYLQIVLKVTQRENYLSRNQHKQMK